MTAALRRVPRAAVTQARSYRILVPGALVALALLTGLVLVVAGGILLGAVPVQAGRGGAALPAEGLSLVSLAVIGCLPTRYSTVMHNGAGSTCSSGGLV